MSGRWKILISIESSIILNQSHQSFLGHGTECQKKNQEPESQMSVRPLAFANNARAWEGGLVTAVVKAHVDVRCQRATGFECCHLFGNLHSPDCCFFRTAGRKRRQYMGGKDWKAEKWWIQKLCPFTFIWALPHSHSWGHPSQCLHPLSNSQLVGVLTNASPFC